MLMKSIYNRKQLLYRLCFQVYANSNDHWNAKLTTASLRKKVPILIAGSAKERTKHLNYDWKGYKIVRSVWCVEMRTQ